MPKLYNISCQEDPETVPADATMNLALAAEALWQGRDLTLDQKRDSNKLWALGAFPCD